MANPLTLARVWRILKEVDLEAIRREAEAPVRVLVVAEAAGDADDLAVLFAAGHPDATRSVTAADAALAQAQAGTGKEPVVDGPDVVVLIARGGAMSPALGAARDAWAGRNVPLVAVTLQDPITGHRPHGPGEAPYAASVSVAALDAGSLGDIASTIFAVVRPDQRLALARQLPGLRPCVFEELISETAKANAGYALSTGLAEIIPVLDVPLNIGDMIILSKNQLVMAYRIALAAGKRGRPTELIAEIVGVLGGGLIFRQLARQLVGLVPVIGLVPKVAVAYGGTWAIGRAVVLWAAEREKLTRGRLRELSREGLTRGRAVADAMRRRAAERSGRANYFN
jgi:uncharacterized protein (DUF697 family)